MYDPYGILPIIPISEPISNQYRYFLLVFSAVPVPIYINHPFGPPENPLNSLLWQQILKLDEKQLKQYLKRFFEFLGDTVILPKATRDQGVDLILT